MGTGRKILSVMLAVVYAATTLGCLCSFDVSCACAPAVDDPEIHACCCSPAKPDDSAANCCQDGAHTPQCCCHISTDTAGEQFPYFAQFNPGALSLLFPLPNLREADSDITEIHSRRVILFADPTPPASECPVEPGDPLRGPPSRS